MHKPIHEPGVTDPIGSIQDFLTAKTTDDMVRAFVPLQGITTVQPVEAVRRVSRQLGEVNRAYLLDAVRAAVEAGRGGRDAAVAWEDAEGLPVPAVPSPVFSERACRLLLRLGKLRSLEQYRCHREQLLAAVRFLPGAEAETVSGALAEQLQDLLIEEVLGGRAGRRPRPGPAAGAVPDAPHGGPVAPGPAGALFPHPSA